MGIFDKSTVLERYEKQFKVKEMQNKRLFYDLYARVEDPEELRGYAHELMQDMGWKTSVSELTKWEEPDTEGVFRGGRLKPIKHILKSHKQFIKGPKFPWLWKLFFAVGCIFLAFYIFTLVDTGRVWNSTLVLEITPVWFVLAIIIYMIKEKVNMAVWLKISGIYNVQDEQADVRIVLAADAEKPDKEAFDKLEEDLSEMYNVLSKKYIRRAKLTLTKGDLAKELSAPAKKDPEKALLNAIRDVDKQIAELDTQLASGKIQEATYKEVKADLLQRKSKFDTLLDLMNV
jgi:hypothetical protein